METRMEIITPEIAREYLTMNFGNRPLKVSRVNTYASDMASGKWSLTHQGIAFDNNGHLIDGQNRLTAIVKSGASIPMLVTRGIDRDSAMHNIDNGAGRSAYEALHIKHGREAYGKTALSIVRAIYRYTSTHTNFLSYSNLEIACKANDDLLTRASSERELSTRKLACGILVGYIAAYLNGLPWEKIQRFSHLAFRNEVDPNVNPRTTKAVLDYGNRALGNLSSSSHDTRRTLINATKSALYTYDHELMRLRKDDADLYPIKINDDWKIVKA